MKNRIKLLIGGLAVATVGVALQRRGMLMSTSAFGPEIWTATLIGVGALLLIMACIPIFLLKLMTRITNHVVDKTTR